MPYGQMIRLKHNCSKQSDCINQVGIIAERLRGKKYPKQIIVNAKTRAVKLDRGKCLEEKDKKEKTNKNK